MTQSSAKPAASIEAKVDPEITAQFAEPGFLMLAGLGLGVYAIGKWVIGPRDPKKSRKWWDYRRID